VCYIKIIKINKCEEKFTVFWKDVKLMIKRKARKIVAVFSVLAVFFLFQIGTFAQEQLLLTASNEPSEWAVESVEWSKIYGLAPENMYKNYTSKVTMDELYSVCVSVYEAATEQSIIPSDKSLIGDTFSETILKAYSVGLIKEDEKLEPQREVTRLDMVTCTYETIKAAQPVFSFQADIELTFNDADSIPD